MFKNRKIISIAMFSVVLLTTVFFAFIDNSRPHRQDNRLFIPILMYHSVSEKPFDIPELSVTPEAFDDQMKYLSSNGYTPINLDEIDNCSQYKKPIIVTFDDGYKDNYTCAYPILKKYNIKATIFMVTKYINGGGFLTKDEIVQMGDLVSFQSHTVDHERLDWYNLDQVDYECRQSQKVLGEITNKPVYAISFPNGAFTTAILRIAEKYYSCAITTLPGKNAVNCNKYQLRRIAVSRDATLADFQKRLN